MTVVDITVKITDTTTVKARVTPAGTLTLSTGTTIEYPPEVALAAIDDLADSGDRP